MAISSLWCWNYVIRPPEPRRALLCLLSFVLVAHLSRLWFWKAVRPAVPAAFCRPAGLPQAAVTAWRPAVSQKRVAAIRTGLAKLLNWFMPTHSLRSGSDREPQAGRLCHQNKNKSAARRGTCVAHNRGGFDLNKSTISVA